MPSKSDKFKAKQKADPKNTPRRKQKKQRVNRMLKRHRRSKKRERGPILSEHAPIGVSPDNMCEGCTLCCKVMAVDDANPPTPVDTWCVHCDKGIGCMVWGDTEAGWGNQCRDFECVWLQAKKAHLAGDRKAAAMCTPALRPDRTKVVLMPTTDEGQTGIVCHVDTTSPLAYKDEPLWPILKTIMAAGKMVLIRCGDARKVIGGESDPRVQRLKQQMSTGAAGAPPAANS